VAQVRLHGHDEKTHSPYPRGLTGVGPGVTGSRTAPRQRRLPPLPGSAPDVAGAGVAVHSGHGRAGGQLAALAQVPRWHRPR